MYELSTRNIDGILQVEISGRPDPWETRDSRDGISQLVNAECPYIAISLEKTQVLNSRVLGTFIALAETLQENGGELVLCGVPSRLQYLVDMIRLPRIVRIFDTLEEAAAALRERISSF